MASHELKTPVTSLKGFTQILHKYIQHSADAQTLLFIDRMERQVNKLTKLISDLLDLSKLQTGNLVYREEFFDLATLVADAVELLQATTSTHQLHLEPVAHLPVFGDSDRLGQVLINLLSNAIKYSPKADTVVIRVERDQKRALVSIQDFGIGIAPAHHERIFERFYQVTGPTEKAFPGLGIGLYLAHEIITRHHGRLWVESTKGQGSTFRFTLPLYHADTQKSCDLLTQEVAAREVNEADTSNGRDARGHAH